MSRPTWLGLPVKDGARRGPFVLALMDEDAWVRMEVPCVLGDPEEPTQLVDVIESSVKRVDADTRAFATKLIDDLRKALR